MLIFPFSDDESSLFEGLKPIEQLLGTAGNYVVILTRYYEHTSTKQETFQTISSLRAVAATNITCVQTYLQYSVQIFIGFNKHKMNFGVHLQGWQTFWNKDLTGKWTKNNYIDSIAFKDFCQLFFFI